MRFELQQSGVRSNVLGTLPYRKPHRTPPMKVAFTLLQSFGFAVALLSAVATHRSTAAEPKRFFRADAPDAAPYTLPDPLVDRSGKKITTTADWEKTRRPEVLELFRQHVYGRVPTTPY